MKTLDKILKNKIGEIIDLSFDEGENCHFDDNVFCIPQETDWQKARYEENIVNDSQWLELIQYETQNDSKNYYCR